MRSLKSPICVFLCFAILLSVMAFSGSTAYAAPPKDAVVITEADDSLGELYGTIGDADGNDKINVKDVTTIQKHLAKIIVLDRRFIDMADVDENELFNVKDATALQKYLAKYETNLRIGDKVYTPK